MGLWKIIDLLCCVHKSKCVLREESTAFLSNWWVVSVDVIILLFIIYRNFYGKEGAREETTTLSLVINKSFTFVFKVYNFFSLDYCTWPGFLGTPAMCSSIFALNPYKFSSKMSRLLCQWSWHRFLDESSRGYYTNKHNSQHR